MFGKVVKPNNGTPDELEKSIGEALLDLEVNSDLKTQLRELYITGAKELEVGDKKKCLIVFVPVPLLKQFQKIQVIILYNIIIIISHSLINYWKGYNCRQYGTLYLIQESLIKVRSHLGIRFLCKGRFINLCLPQSSGKVFVSFLARAADFWLAEM